MNHRITYESLKAAAKQKGMKVTDLIALSPSNDPWAAGKPADVRLARWFAELWQSFGYTEGVHIRRMHYQIISQDPPVELPDDSGAGYENTERCWDILNAAAKQARYLGYVDPLAFVDRRNPQPVIYNAGQPDDPYVGTTRQLADDFAALPDFPSAPTYTLTNYNAQGRQRYLVEICAEKSTMNDVLLPICERHGFNLVTGLGELSITAALAAVRRIFALGKPARILYISDFDPAGASMPVAYARKVEFFVRELAKEYPEADVRLEPIVLTAAQVRQYQLPRTPIKETERRAARFEQRFGEGAVELDALEALYPGQLEQIVLRAAGRYYDDTLETRIRDERERLVRDLLRERDAAIDERAGDIAEVRARYAEARAQAEAILEPVLRDLRTLWNELEDALRDRALDPDEYPLPEPEEARERESDLYDSSRSYGEQLAAYKRHQQKVS